MSFIGSLVVIAGVLGVGVVVVVLFIGYPKTVAWLLLTTATAFGGWLMLGVLGTAAGLAAGALVFGFPLLLWEAHRDEKRRAAIAKAENSLAAARGY